MAFRAALYNLRPTLSGSRVARYTRSLRKRSTSSVIPVVSQPTRLYTSDPQTFEKEFQQKQKVLSESLQASPNTILSQEEHTQHQIQVFDEMADFFDSDEATPPQVVPVLQAMAQSMISDMILQRNKGAALQRPARVNKTFTENVFHILDVGCGTGALFEFYLKAAEEQDITIHITGFDVAPKMVEKAQENGKQLLQTYPSKSHSIQVQLGDICDEPFSASPQAYSYDLVVANACFGNFWDPSKALQGMTQPLRLDGLLCLTHPLGSEFVRQLHLEDSKTVPNLLPTRTQFQQLTRTLPLQVLDVIDKDTATTHPSSCSYYKATAVKVVHRTLAETMRLRGTVDSGYGRGGKKLGFPTANLPSRLFQGALQDVPCGVYFGWAVLEGDAIGRNVPHKAVVNVGYSPTFEGQENPEKIVEAHLILDKSSSHRTLDPPDFYGEIMRLQLVGFIRNEMKFPSFPALIAQISTDVEDAKDALDLEEYQLYRKDPFVSNLDKTWVGTGGGDDKASWEFEDVEHVVEKLV